MVMNALPCKDFGSRKRKSRLPERSSSRRPTHQPPILETMMIHVDIEAFLRGHVSLFVVSVSPCHGLSYAFLAVHLLTATTVEMLLDPAGQMIRL